MTFVVPIVVNVQVEVETLKADDVDTGRASAELVGMVLAGRIANTLIPVPNSSVKVIGTEVCYPEHVGGGA